MSWAPIGFRGRLEFAEGETVEIRYLPGDKTWELATYVRRMTRDEVPGRGQLGHVVRLQRLRDDRQVTISCQRIRKLEAAK